MEVFAYTKQRMTCKGHYHVFVWTGENESDTLRVDAYFFGHRKNFPFSKISGYVWTRP